MKFIGHENNLLPSLRYVKILVEISRARSMICSAYEDGWRRRKHTTARLPPFPNSSNSVIPFTKRHGIQRNKQFLCRNYERTQKKESIGGNWLLGADGKRDGASEARRHAMLKCSTITPPPRFAYFKEKTRKSEDKKFIHNSIENETGFVNRALE